MSHQLNCLQQEDLCWSKVKRANCPTESQWGYCHRFLSYTNSLVHFFRENFVFCEKDSNLLVIFHTSVFQVKNVPDPYQVNWHLVTGNGFLTPICTL